MTAPLRPLLSLSAAALLVTLLLGAWIRLQPVPMPPALQVALSLALTAVVAAVLLRAGLREQAGGEG